MKIGITSSSNSNAYAATLICKLIAQGDICVCIICTEKSKAATLIHNIKSSGYIPTIVKLLKRYGAVRSSELISCNYLREYAASNSLHDWHSPLTSISKKHGIEYVKVDSINSKNTVDYVRSHELDLLINASGGIFRAPIINALRIGILNAHMGCLPAFRGMNVLEWSLFYNQKIGVTLHFIDQGIDTGDILMFKEIPVEEGDNISGLRAKSTPISVDLVAECIQLLKQGNMTGKKQQPEEGLQYFVMHPRLNSLIERNIGESTTGMAQTQS